MRKVIAAINITIDGFCDHTVMVAADDELHEHYSDLLSNAGVLVYGRVTYQMMEEYWPSIIRNPTGNSATDRFAVAMDKVPKIVFSRTLKKVDWQNTTLLHDGLSDKIQELKNQPGRDIFIGSPSLISTLASGGLIDEYQLCVHPAIVGKGLQLFKHVNEMMVLKLEKSKTFRSGAVTHYYTPSK